MPHCSTYALRPAHLRVTPSPVLPFAHAYLCTLRSDRSTLLSVVSVCFASPSSPGCSVCAVKHLCHHYGAYSHHGHLVGDDAALPTRTAVPCSAFRLDRSADLIDAKGALPRHQARFTLIVRTSSARVIERRTTGYLTDDGDGLQGVHLWWRGVVTILSNMWALRAARSLYSL